MKRLALTLILAAGLPLAAQAVEYTQVQTARSNINFAYKQMGVGMDGKFGKFTAQLNFDPAKPAAAKATLDVDLASIDTGSSEATRKSSASSGSTPRLTRPRISFRARSRRSAATATKSPAS